MLFRKKNKLDYQTLCLHEKAGKKVKVSCIIPAWNEEVRIHTVIQSIKNFDCFDEIIVVDDGSKDNTADVILNYSKEHSHIKLLQNPKNMGKTATVINGVNASYGEVTVILDADIIGLNHLDLHKLIYYVISGKYDLTILDRAGDRIGPLGWSNLTRFLGGERAFWKRDFLNLDLSLEKKDGYLLEVAQNQYYIDTNKGVKTIYCKNLHTIHQYHKFGFLVGTGNYIKMYWRIFRKFGIKNYFRFWKYIEEDRVKGLYWLNKKVRFRLTYIIVLTSIITATITFILLNLKRRQIKKLRNS
jgi:glycosyltransferase involved in cell wall biosynthesis